jgi:hypothetical protein
MIATIDLSRWYAEDTECPDCVRWSPRTTPTGDLLEYWSGRRWPS